MTSETELAQLLKWLEDGQFYFGFFSVLVPGIWFVDMALPFLLADAMTWAGTSK